METETYTTIDRNRSYDERIAVVIREVENWSATNTMYGNTIYNILVDGARENIAKARLQGRMEAYAKAMRECSGIGGGRDIAEIRTAIDILHLATLQELRRYDGNQNLHDD